jgi:16S rRNA (uracil1498-N3)-methyltransferase
MARYDFNAPRLFLESDLAEGARVALTREQSNYLINVLRLRDGDALLAFNGRHGEWRMRISMESRRDAVLVGGEQVRPQEPACDLLYMFAPLKHARLDYMVQKAVEMGASRLAPVMTHRTQAQRVNLERMRANAVEAAEQCGVLNVAEVQETQKLEQVLAGWDPARKLIFCDEDAPPGDPVGRLRQLAGAATAPLAVLIGPEGGFDDAERRLLLSCSFVLCISLGPRILRADTAAVAALAVVQTALGDWR